MIRAAAAATAVPNRHAAACGPPLQIDLRTGHRVETDLCGGICESKDQKQRVYQVYTDGDKIQ